MRVGIRVGITVGIRVGIRVGMGRTSLSVPVTLGSEASGPSPRLGGPAGTPPFAAGCGLGAGAVPRLPTAATFARQMSPREAEIVIKQIANKHS